MQDVECRMNAVRIQYLAFCVASLCSVTAGAAQDQPPAFVSSSSELVVLPVVVTDRRGAFVADLPRDRFAVFDNGRRQDVSLFTNEDTPVSVALVMDYSGSMAAKLPEVIVAMTAFARSSNPDDELLAIAFNDTVTSGAGPIQAGGDAATLETALRAFRPQGRTALYDALSAALDQVEQGSRARKAVIVLSDGGDNASRATLDQVLARARRSNVTVFTIGLFDDDDADRNPGVLKSLAQSTGGERFLPRTPSQLLEACERIARELRSGYTIGYVPPDRDGAYHRVRVHAETAGRARLTIRTRPGYFAAAPSTQHR